MRGIIAGMALTATIYNFDVELADSDRNVYESLALRVAQHPSESDEYLIARVLAYLVEYREGIEFSRGVSDPDEPMISIRDLTGKITDVDRHRHARRGAAAQGVEGCGARRGVLPQGRDAVAEGARRRRHPPRRRARALCHRSRLHRRDGRAPGSPHGIQRVDHRSRAVSLDRRRTTSPAASSALRAVAAEPRRRVQL